MIIDVAALDVIDSFATSTLRNLAEMARLRGAQTVIVGIQPDVAFAMVELGMDTGTVVTALDLEEGLHYLERAAGPPSHRSGFCGTLAVTELERLQRNYRTAFLRYLPSRDEAALHLGYEIGRAAMAGGLSLLDLAQVHHRILIEVLRTAPTKTSTLWSSPPPTSCSKHSPPMSSLDGASSPSRQTGQPADRIRRRDPAAPYHWWCLLGFPLHNRAAAADAADGR